jgi:hypothetical protein
MHESGGYQLDSISSMFTAETELLVGTDGVLLGLSLSRNTQKWQDAALDLLI